MKTMFFESLHYKLITKNDFYYCSCPDNHFKTRVMLLNCLPSGALTFSPQFSQQLERGVSILGAEVVELPDMEVEETETFETAEFSGTPSQKRTILE